MLQKYQDAVFADRRTLHLYYPLRHAREGGFRIGDLEISRQDRTQHVLIIGGTGAGKGVLLMIPNLMRDMMSGISTVFTDIKSPEMFHLLSRIHTAMSKTNPDYRRLFVAFCPFESENTICWNPIDTIRTFGEAATWTEIVFNNSSVLESSGTSSGAEFYILSEKALLRSLMIFVNNTVYRQKQRNNFATILRLLSLKQNKRNKQSQLKDKLMNEVYKIENEGKGGELTPVWEVIREDLSDLFEMDDTDLIGIIKGVKNRLSLFKDPRVAAATSRSEVHLRNLGLEPMTLILGVPSAEAEKAKLLTALFLEGLVKELRDQAGRVGGRLGVDVAIYLDEAGNLGRYRLPEWLSSVRSCGIGFISVFQSLGQIAELFGLYGRDTVLTNSHNQIVLYNCGTEAATYYSKKLGDYINEKKARGKSTTSGGSLGGSVTHSQNPRESLWPLMPPHAIEKMTFAGKPGIRYRRNFFRQLVLDKQGRRVMEGVRALVFPYATNPALTWLQPYYLDTNILELIDQGEIIPLRQPQGLLEQLDPRSLLYWDLHEDDSTKQSGVAVKSTPQPIAEPTPIDLSEAVPPTPRSKPPAAKLPEPEAASPPPPVLDTPSPAPIPPHQTQNTSSPPSERHSPPPQSTAPAPRQNPPSQTTNSPATARHNAPPYPATALCPICKEETLRLKPNIVKGGFEYRCSRDMQHLFDAQALKQGELTR